MTIITPDIAVDQVRVVRLENDHLSVEVSPETGGRITRLAHKALGRDFLWRNERVSLARVEPGVPYDPNFYGGIDDIIPGDLPEVIDGLSSPDHGELWSLPLEGRIEGGAFIVSGRLPIWGLHLSKRVVLRADGPWVDLDYTIDNRSGARRSFLWKLHAALAIDPGDRIVCPAQSAVAADPAWSRWGIVEPFAWPDIAGSRADIVPPRDGTTDFLFLYGLRAGQVGLRRPTAGCELRLDFDTAVFPYVCTFASYGGFDGHVTAILEPCTAMPLSVVEAARLGQCSTLDAGQRLQTRVSLYAGPLLS
jgi:hypothetical protein